MIRLGYVKSRSGRGNDFDWVSLLTYYKQSVSSSDTVLEIGASEVELTRELSKYCRELIGVELFPERTPIAFDNVRYVTGDWQCLSQYVEPETIDLAVASHVLEHISDDLKAINELYVVLKPGGIAVLTTPNRKRLTRVIIELFSRERQFPFWEHEREYTEGNLVELIEASLFQEYEILPRVFGLHGGPVFVYVKRVPCRFRQYANFWEVRLHKAR